jgi:DNA-binding MarR family transcriptional regulator
MSSNLIRREMRPVEDSVDRWVREHDWANHPELDLQVEGIINRIHILAKYLKRSFDETASEFGINKGELDVLKLLRRAGPPHHLSPSRLADGLHLSSGAMTNRLDRLETQGLIARRADPADRRGIIIELSEKGSEIFDSAIESQIAKENALCAPLSASERQQLSDLLRRLMLEIESTPGFPWKR